MVIYLETEDNKHVLNPKSIMTALNLDIQLLEGVFRKNINHSSSLPYFIDSKYWLMPVVITWTFDMKCVVPDVIC